MFAITFLFQFKIKFCFPQFANPNIQNEWIRLANKYKFSENVQGSTDPIWNRYRKAN